jgi:hypothetical protein
MKKISFSTLFSPSVFDFQFSNMQQFDITDKASMTNNQKVTSGTA